MEKRLIRKMPGKMIGGVAAGLAEYLDIDATIVRLLFVLATFFHGAGLLIYIVLWIAMPAGGDGLTYSGQGSGTNPDDTNPDPVNYSGTGASTGGSPSPGAADPGGSDSSGSRSAAVIGWILVGLGIFFLMDEFLEPWFRDFFYWFNFRRIWPVIFIIVGVLIISSATKKQAARPPGNPGPSGDSGPSGGRESSGGPGRYGGDDSSGGRETPGRPGTPPAASPGAPALPGDSPSSPESKPPPSPGSPSAPEKKPRVPGEGSLNGPDTNDKV